MSLKIVYIPVMSSKDLEGVLSAIVEHWELQGVRKAKNRKKKKCNSNTGHSYPFKWIKKIPTYQK